MKKSKFQRSTKEVSLSQIHPQFIEYLNEYALMHSLQNEDIRITDCFETSSTYKTFFGKQKVQYTVIGFSENFLFWSNIIPGRRTGMAAVKWNDILEVCNWENTIHGRMMEDSGVEIFGTIYNWVKRSRWGIFLGKDLAADKFRSLLRQRVGDKYKKGH